MKQEKIIGAVEQTANKVENTFGFKFTTAESHVVTPYDNVAACAELKKDMKRGDSLSIKFSIDTDNYPCVWVESKNVAPYKVRLNPTIFSWIMQYLDNGTVEYQYSPESMQPIEIDGEAYKVEMLQLFINGGKKIQWTPLFRERNGKLSGNYVAKYGKVFFYVKHTEELITWLRDRKQPI